MVNIVHCRVDDRLIHGQVATAWLPHTKANLCLIANDAVSLDANKQTLLKMAAPAGVELRFFSIEKTIAVIGKAADRQHIFLLLDNLDDAAKLVKAGVPVTDINIGNISSVPGKIPLTRTVYVEESDYTAMREIIAAGVSLNYRLLPTDAIEDLAGKL